MTDFQKRFHNAQLSVAEMVEGQAFAMSRATGMGIDVILTLIRSASMELGAYLVAGEREEMCPECGGNRDDCGGSDEEDGKIDTEIG